MSYQWKFNEKILDLSKSNNLEECYKEWSLIFEDEKEDKCICSHPIMQRFHFLNDQNEEKIIVGNCCIKFLDIELYNKLRNYNKDKKEIIRGNIRTSVIQYNSEIGRINNFEADFLKNIMRKQKLTDKQVSLKNKILNKIQSNDKCESCQAYFYKDKPWKKYCISCYMKNKSQKPKSVSPD